MDALNATFAVSGVQVNVLIPPLVAFVISFLSSMGGLSGAFLILPFMVSSLGYAGPSASATNFVFNIAAIPSGVYRYTKEGRVLWPLVAVFVAGTLPGLAMGYYLRVQVFSDPARFKLLVGTVLMYMGAKLFVELTGGGKNRKNNVAGVISGLSLKARAIHFEINGERHSFRIIPLLLLSLAVGVIGGAYGIGGGAIIVPYLVAVAGLPVYAVAGASLVGTFITSVAGVAFYSLLPLPGGTSAISTSPDWMLGLLFGAGGAVGIYLGARMQKHVPERLIKSILFVIITGIAIKYLSGIAAFFR